jgi:hypothetical protein
MRTVLLRGIVAALCLAACHAVPGRAQAPVPPVHLPTPDTTRPSPFNYFARSLLLPGWGQAALDRKLTGGLFLAFEGVALGMALKAHSEVGYLERTGSERLEEKRQERQDWFVLLAMNHLLSGLEAFVSANLFDFPADLRAQQLPDGRTGLGVRMALPR